jgi:hypothetical protein
MNTCTAWFKKKFKTRLQKVPQAAQMDFYGLQGLSIILHVLHLGQLAKCQTYIYSKFSGFRAMDFLVELFRNLLEQPDWTMTQACTDSYTKTLKKFHGWLASSSFTVISHSIWVYT